MKPLIVFLVALASIVPSYLLHGFTLAKVWMWFVVPIFQLPPLLISHAIGLTIVFNALSWGGEMSIAENKEGAELVGAMLGVSFLRPIILLVSGWIIKGFM